MKMAKMGLAQCLLKLNNPKEALNVLNECENIENDLKYHSTKLLVLVDLFKNEEDNEIKNETKNTILQLCDKIETVFNDHALTNNIRLLLQ